MALIHAGSMLQGTFVYLSYSWFPGADKKGQIPVKQYNLVSTLNLMVVGVAHGYMIRCLYKHKPDCEVHCQRVCCEDEEEEEEEESVCYEDEDDDDDEEEDHEECLELRRRL